MICTKHLGFIVATALLGVVAAFAQMDAGGGGAAGMEALGTKLPDVGPDGVARIGNVSVDPKARTVSVKGWVNQVVGPIELLACGPGGKTHESVFVLDINPVELQTGLLLLGLKPGTPPTGLGEGVPSGPELVLWVDWEENGEARSRRAEEFVFNEEVQERLPETPWIFTGSVFEEGRFKALAEESLVVTYWDPWAIVNIPLPCGANDKILSVDTNTVPPLSTPIVMRFIAPPAGKESR